MAYVIGTAGHVDHGKSTLVEALTGIDPDRLAEEKEREMTIDLGFAWLTLPGGQPVGIVDVPGHRDFIENMLAGVGGIDAALFVVAADEGVMPQTREHLAILDLLAVPGGVVALTKSDLAEDGDWLALVRADVAGIMQGTVLEGAPIVPVSARTGHGLDGLVSALEAALAGRGPRPDRGMPRLPVDRVFSMSGFGTVVTGTLVDGTLRVEDEVEIQPKGLRARVRGAQSHKEAIDVAQPGSRVALNLGGVDVSQIARGDVVAAPGALAGSQLVDVSFNHLPDAGRPLKHNAEVKFFTGAAEVVARVRLLGAEQTPPAESGWLQLRLAEPVAAVKGDRFILRYPSPGQTIGGGVILDPHPARRWRRFRPEVIERLETLAAGTPDEVAEQALEAAPAGLTVVSLAAQAGMDEAEGAEVLASLVDEGRALALEGGLVFGVGAWARMVASIREDVAAYHVAYPLRLGMPREQVRSRLHLEPKVFTLIIEAVLAQGVLNAEGTALVRLPEHAITLSEAQQASVDALLADFATSPAAPPTYKDAAGRVGEEVMQFLLARGDLVAASPEIVFEAQAYHQMVQAVRDTLSEHGALTVAQARDLFGTSRKYVLALLEHTDRQAITKRVGDERVLGSAGR